MTIIVRIDIITLSGGANKLSKKFQKIVIFVMLFGLLGSSVAVSLLYLLG